MSGQPVLLIKHGALGDIVIATAAMSAIRRAFPDAPLTLLTGASYVSLLRDCPFADEVWADSKPGIRDLRGLRGLREQLRSRPWQWIFDLQTSTRSGLYPFLLPRPWPNISGVRSWMSHGYTDPARHGRHSLENDIRQLALAGINVPPMPDLRWLQAEVASFNLPPRYALFVPGGAAHRPQKRWPQAQYAQLAQRCLSAGITPVLVGTEAEAQVIREIEQAAAGTLSLIGRTSIAQLASLARGAVFALGNDTGPMHVVAAAGAPSLVLFGPASSAARSCPIGRKVVPISAADLAQLSAQDVASTLIAEGLLPGG